MPLLQTHTGKKLLFIHIPKTGGQTIEFEFKSLIWDFNETHYKILWGINPEKTIEFSHLGYHDIITNYPEAFAQADEIFTIVRHPYDRFISQFNFWHKWKKMRRIMNVEIDFSFEEYVEQVEAIHLQHSKKPYSQFEMCHYQPMSDFVLHEDKIPQNLKILRYENYNEEVLQFLKGENSPTPEELTELPVVNCSHRCKEKENYLNDKTKSALTRLYAKDFELFNYEM